MNFKSQPRALNQNHLLLQLKDLVTGLRHHLEEERAMGLEGWPKSSVPPRKKAPSPPPASPSSVARGAARVGEPATAAAASSIVSRPARQATVVSEAPSSPPLGTLS